MLGHRVGRSCGLKRADIDAWVDAPGFPASDHSRFAERPNEMSAPTQGEENQLG